MTAGSISPQRADFAPTPAAAAPSAAGTAGSWAGPLLFAALVFTGLLMIPDRLLGDPDTQWHIAIGAEIWRDRAVPWFDSHSHTFAGAPWIAKEWLSQLLLFGAFRAAGWTGIVTIAAVAIGMTFAILFGWLAGRLRASVAFGLTLAAVMFLAPHFLARPHVFALPTLLLWTIGLVAAAEDGTAPRPWLLAVLALWANLHGSFTIAYPLAAAIGAETVLAAPADRRLAFALRWAAFGAGSLAAGCVSPYGVHAMLVTASLFGSGESLPYLLEWQPLAIDATGVTALALAGLLVLLLAFEPRANAVRIVTLVLLTAMAVRHSRFLDVLALAAPVLAAGPLRRRWAALAPEGIGLSGASLRLRVVAIGIVAAIGIALAATGAPETAPSVTPTAALAAAQREGVAGPVYNDYDFGGFLIAQGVPTFIDGRTDQLFLGGFISGLYRAVRSEDGAAFLSLLDRHRVAWTLIRPTSPEARHLDASTGWRRIHSDPVASVYVRAGAGLPSTRPAP